MNAAPERISVDYQRALFDRLDEFFYRATGTSAPEFATIADFPETIKKEAQKLAQRASDAYPWIERQLRELYSAKGVDAFRASRQLGGFKLVQGGGSGFHESQLNAVRGSLLYADTVLVPDPVLPWIETERSEERFRLTRFFQNIHALLHLKPLVDAQLPYPAIIVFPSWEKLLEKKDSHTQQGIDQLITDVLAHFVSPKINSLKDAVRIGDGEPDNFIERMERSGLLVAPGGALAASAQETFDLYEKHIETWRAKNFIDEFRRLSPVKKSLFLLMERITPQYHLAENAEELAAQPLLSVEQQAHYFKIVAQTNTGRLEKLGLINRNTSLVLESFSRERLSWLANIPLNSLVEVRKQNENAQFRKRLDGAIGRLHESSLANIDRVTAEICSEIDHALAEHQQELNKIETDFRQKNIKTAGAVVAVASAALVPSLAPYIGAALPLAVAAKYGWDRWDKRVEERKRSKSLMGIIAVAKQTTGQS